MSNEGVTLQIVDVRLLFLLERQSIPPQPAIGRIWKHFRFVILLHETPNICAPVMNTPQ